MSDYDYLPTSGGSGDAPLMHITGNRTIGSMTLAVDTVANVPTKFIATTGTLLASGYIDPATKRDFKGHITGSAITIDSFEAGSTDAGNTIGQVVIIKPNTGWADRVAAFMKNMTNKGTPEAVTVSDLTATGTITLPAGSITTTNLASASVTNAKIGTTAGELGGVWTTWSPTYTGMTVGNGTISARYMQVGKTVFCSWEFVLNTTSNIGAGITVSLPVTAVAPLGTYKAIGQVMYLNPSGAFWGGVRLNGTGSVVFESFNAAGTYVSTAQTGLGVPAAWTATTSNTLGATFIYEGQ